MDRVKQLLVNDWYSAKATKLKSPSCRTLLVLILWGATKWDKPAKWEGYPLARLVPLRGPLLYLRIRVIGKALPEMTPYEAWFGRKPKLSHLRILDARPTCIFQQMNDLNSLPNPKNVCLYRVL
jgi:hypothetical protein